MDRPHAAPLTHSRTRMARSRIAPGAPARYRAAMHITSVVTAPCLASVGRVTVAAVILAVAAPAHAEPVAALRAGWAYGLGLELEVRPARWGIGVSGGYVPGYGPGGYLGAQWGRNPIGRSGPVAEAGVFRGIHNPLRVADTGLGVYLQAGYTLAAGPLSVRAVAGGGLPLGDPDHRISFELLAKLTVGVAF